MTSAWLYLKRNIVGQRLGDVPAGGSAGSSLGVRSLRELMLGILFEAQRLAIADLVESHRSSLELPGVFGREMFYVGTKNGVVVVDRFFISLFYVYFRTLCV